MTTVEARAAAQALLNRCRHRPEWMCPPLPPEGSAVSDEVIRVAVIVGSVRRGRIGPTVATWLLSQLSEVPADLETDLIDLAELDLPADLGGGNVVEAYLKRIDRADAFIVVTPEYNHGYPGGLKIAIDTARDEWKAKPVAFVSYGGMAGGLRAVEQLRPIFAELHAVTIRAAVSFHWVHDQFADGHLRQPQAAQKAVQTMLGQLLWWSRTLRRGRADGSYDG